jgi:hypothetical protein
MERTIPRTTTVFSTAKDLFDRILDAQRATSPVQSTNFQRMTDQFIEPEKLAMNRRTSVVYDRQLYPEMEVSEAQQTEFHFILCQIQLMKMVRSPSLAIAECDRGGVMAAQGLRARQATPTVRGASAYSRRSLIECERQAIMHPSGVGSEQTDIAS